MRSRRRPPISPRELFALLGSTLAGLTVAMALLGANMRLSSLAPGGARFFTVWTGTRAFLFQGQDPYSVATSVEASRLALHGAQGPNAIPNRLSIPFFLLPLFFPLALVSDPAAARGVWGFLAEAALVGSVFVALRILEWRPPRLFTFAFSLFTILGYYSVAALAQGSGAILLLLLCLGILWAIQGGQDELAGALLVLCLCLWEVVLPFLVLVVWRAIHEQRWRILAGFGMMLAILLVVSFLLYPGWLLPFLTASVATIRSQAGVNTGVVLSRLVPRLGSQVAWALAVLLVGMLAYESAMVRHFDSRRFVWTACLALAAAPLVGFRTETANLVALVPGFVLISAAAHQRHRGAVWFAAFVLALSFGVPWTLFWRWIVLRDQLSADLLFLLYPCLCLFGLYWTRWWFLRPTRTWLDEVRAASQ